jgi:hypothetical protein
MSRFMVENIINQLHFRKNSETILPFIKKGNYIDEAPELFTLSSIEPIPDYLNGPLTKKVKRFSLMNVEPLKLEGLSERIAAENLYKGNTSKQSKEVIEKKIMESRDAVRSSSQNNLSEVEVEVEVAALDSAIENLQNYGVVSLLDWKLVHWGTPNDILSVAESTFVVGTPFLEFNTAWAPPIPAIKALANIFPSVRFELLYKHSSEEQFHKVEVFPQNPFGY